MEKDPFSVAAGDFNGDGWVDVAVGTGTDSAMTIFINQSTTPAEPGVPCNGPEDCESEECLGPNSGGRWVRMGRIGEIG
jgi:hypothetical protein